MFNKPRKLLYFSSAVWRKIHLYKRSPYYSLSEKFMYERSSVIPNTFLGSKMFVYTGKAWIKRYANKWLVGFKFGEFTKNRVNAIYKAKQIRKKKLKLAKKNKK